MSETPIALIGAGKIAEIHADAIRALPGLRVSAVTDTNPAVSSRLAERLDADSFTDLDDLLKSGVAERAHILTPPETHAGLATKLAAGNMPFLVEKPSTSGAADGEVLLKNLGDVCAGVNQNSLYNAGFREILAASKDARFGPLESVHMTYAAPLRQLDAGQVGHWMFQEPRNILLEQAVHPLAQIRALLGQLTLVQSTPGPGQEIGDGRLFYDRFQLAFQGKAPASMSFQVGAPYPVWRLVAHFKDGLMTGDMLKGSVQHEGRSRFLEALDYWITERKAGNALKTAANRGLTNYVLSMLGLQDRSDVFYDSMKRSIKAFHDAVSMNQDPLASIAFGHELVCLCEEAAPKPTPGMKQSFNATDAPEKGRILVTGGTGFIGRAVVRKLLDAGYGVTIVARTMANLPPLFAHPHVTLLPGDARSHSLMSKAAKNTIATINLAHGGGGDSYAAVKAAMLGALEAPVEAANAAGHQAFIHLGSIAGLYLGDAQETIIGSTPPDPRADLRADYARAKADCDLALMALMKAGLPAVILRPGIVIGEGTAPQHSGVGLFNNEQHCLGWSDGTTPLPFVLVDDVADACVRALERKTAIGNCYNLVGDVRPGAKDYMATLARLSGRPFTFHPQSPRKITFLENMKVLIKKLAGKKQPFHSLHEFKSRAMYARFDTEDARRDLDWHPVSDDDAFNKAAFGGMITARSEGKVA